MVFRWNWTSAGGRLGLEGAASVHALRAVPEAAFTGCGEPLAAGAGSSLFSPKAAVLASQLGTGQFP